MAEGEVGAVAPVETVPGTQPVSAPAAPVVQDKAPPAEGDQSVKPPKTYTEEEVRKVTSERLSKERRRLERTVRAEMERDFYKQQVENPRQTQQPAHEDKGPPKAEDYKDVTSFVRDVLKYERAQERAAEERERQTREPQERHQQSVAEFSRSLQEKLSEGAEKHEDFEEVVFANDVPFTDPVVAAIHESDMPSELAYYLATHKDELRRIAKLPSTHQAWEVREVERKLKAPPKPTGAPPPIVPGGGSAGATKDLAHMTPAEHVAAYRRSKRK